jgi:hypothetical protein
MQTDMLWMEAVRRDSPFLAHDLVGAPWSNTCFVCHVPIARGVRCCGRKIDDAAVHALAPNLVGNGGAALRRVDAMLAVLAKYRMSGDRLVAAGDKREPLPFTSSEDVFFANGLQRLGRPPCPRHVALTFGIEQTLPTYLHADAAWAASAHKAYGYFAAPTIRRMLAAYKMVDEDSGDVFQDADLLV